MLTFYVKEARWHKRATPRYYKGRKILYQGEVDNTAVVYVAYPHWLQPASPSAPTYWMRSTRHEIVAI